MRALWSRDDRHHLRILQARRSGQALIHFDELIEAYRGDVLILNTLSRVRRDDTHLCLEDSIRLIDAIRPKLAVLTHFGLTMVRARPWELADMASQATGIRTIAARDRQRLDLTPYAGRDVANRVL